MAKFLNYPRFKAFKDDNSPAAGWKVYSYAAGTTTPQDTYSDQTQVSPNPNPVVLDGSGEGDIWLNPELGYRLKITDENDVVQRDVDGVGVREDADFEDINVSRQITLTIADGTAPMVVTSTTKVANLNADKLDGKDWAAPGTIGAGVRADGSFENLHAYTDLTVERNFFKRGSDSQQSANGAQCIQGQISEEITLDTGGATTDSAADLLPANSLIDCVLARVTEAISVAANWSLGDATTAARFLAATTDVILGTTKTGIAQWNPAGAAPANGPQQLAAAKLRITCNANPAGGKIRVTVFYRQFIAPTS